MTPTKGLVVVCLTLALALATACDGPTSGDAESDPQRQSSMLSPEASTPVDFARAGVTVRLPSGCQPRGMSPTTCDGLRSLEIARVGPLDDLIRPGVHKQGKKKWVGLRLVGHSFVFATASNGEVIADVLDSASSE